MSECSRHQFSNVFPFNTYTALGDFIQAPQLYVLCPNSSTPLPFCIPTQLPRRLSSLTCPKHNTGSFPSLQIYSFSFSHFSKWHYHLSIYSSPKPSSYLCLIFFSHVPHPVCQQIPVSSTFKIYLESHHFYHLYCCHPGHFSRRLLQYSHNSPLFLLLASK